MCVWYAWMQGCKLLTLTRNTANWLFCLNTAIRLINSVKSNERPVFTEGEKVAVIQNNILCEIRIFVAAAPISLLSNAPSVAVAPFWLNTKWYVGKNWWCQRHAQMFSSNKCSLFGMCVCVVCLCRMMHQQNCTVLVSNNRMTGGIGWRCS